MTCEVHFPGCTEKSLHLTSWILWEESKAIWVICSECLLLVMGTCLILAQTFQTSLVSFIGLETLGYIYILKLKLALFIRLLKEESN